MSTTQSSSQLSATLTSISDSITSELSSATLISNALNPCQTASLHVILSYQAEMTSSESMKNENYIIRTNAKTSVAETAESIKLTSSLATSDKNKSEFMKEILFPFLKTHEHFKFKITVSLSSETQAKQCADKASAVKNELKENLFILNFTEDLNLHLNSLIHSQFNFKSLVQNNDLFSSKGNYIFTSLQYKTRAS